MKKLALFLMLGLFLINSVIALDCQYTETENYDIFEEGLYTLGGDYIGAPLEFRDFSGGSMNIQGCNPPSFKAYNPTEKNFVLNISYQTAWGTAFGARSANHQTTISINKYSSSDKLQGSCPDLGSGSISEESIKYEIFEPEEIILKNEKVTKQREICKLCGNGVCLNDGASCNPLYDNSKCGSGICNIAGFCGKLKIIDCPNGKRNCQDKVCLESSTKEQGESYMCSFECKSDRFENGTCLKSSEQIKIDKEGFWRRVAILGIILLIISSILIGKFALIPYVKRRKEEEEKEKKAKEGRVLQEEETKRAKEEYDNLIVKKEETEKAIKENNQNLENLGKEREEIERSLVNEKEKSRKKIDEIRRKEREEIREWEDKKKNKSVEAQKAIDEEINRIKQEREGEIRNAQKAGENIISSLLSKRRTNEILLEKEQKTEDTLKKSIEEKNREIKEIEDTKPERRIERLKNKYKMMYGGEGANKTIFFDEDEKRFKIKYSDGNILRLSKAIYRAIDKNFDGKHIHHIDGDELNDVLGNLIALPSEEHKKEGKFNHYKIRGDTEEERWQSGIHQLREQLGYDTEEKPFPEHIQKELEKRRQQKR